MDLNDWVENVGRRIVEHDLFVPGQNILLGVSGGLDSRVLLEVLARLARRPTHQWQLRIAHFNHQLRGPDSEADEQFVRDLGRQMDLPVIVERGDVRVVAAEQGWSIEMAARDLRHRFFARTAARSKNCRVALAHHADDQAELFLLRLLRGAGSAGLAGMKELNASAIDPEVLLARPFLKESKATLARFAIEEKLGFREDATNSSNEFARNKVRSEVIPLLKEFQPNLQEVLTRQMEILRVEGDFLDQELQAWRKSSPEQDFEMLHPALQRRWLRSQLHQLGLVATFDLVETLRLEANRAVAVGGVVVCRDARGGVAPKGNVPDFVPQELSFGFEGESGRVSFGGKQICWGLQRAALPLPEPRAQCEWFDADKVGGTARLRHWRAGDRFQPLGLAGQPKLQDLFTNAKIDVAARRQALVATTDGGVLWWVEGLRIGDGFKVRPETRHLLKWEWSD